MWRRHKNEVIRVDVFFFSAKFREKKKHNISTAVTLLWKISWTVALGAPIPLACFGLQQHLTVLDLANGSLSGVELICDHLMSPPLA